MRRKILVVSAHPDDETLGCGGTILRHVAEGEEVHWIVLTRAFEPRWPKKTVREKAMEIEEVSKAYKMSSVTKLCFPSTSLEKCPLEDIMEGLRSTISNVCPETVYTVHEGDAHTDHQVAFRASLSVLKAFYMREYGVRRILSFETLSSTDAAPPRQNTLFVPNVYVDITPFMKRKIEIMRIYKSEMQREPLPRSPTSILALGRYRGATIGVKYAEAFALIRETL